MNKWNTEIPRCALTFTQTTVLHNRLYVTCGYETYLQQEIRYIHLYTRITDFGSKINDWKNRMFDILKAITWDISHIIALLVGSSLWWVGRRLILLFYMRKRNKESTKFVEKHADLSWFGSVFAQGSLGAPFHTAHSLKVKDLGEKLRAFLKTDTTLSLHSKEEDLPTNVKGPVVWVNSTRISTFFVFTDKKRVLIYDRGIGKQISKNQNLRQQTYENERPCDMFGSKAFNGAGLEKKIPNPNFHEATVIRIDAIPGIAIEDMYDTLPLDSRRTILQSAAAEEAKINCTVVMVGFCIELSPADLDKACMPMAGVSDSAVAVYDVHGTSPVEGLQTSKAVLGIKYLRTMYP